MKKLLAVGLSAAAAIPARAIPAPALMLGSVLSLQFGQALGKQLAGAVGAPGAVALRLGLAAVLLLLLYRPSLPRTRKDAALVLAFGTAIAGMNLIYPALLLLPLGLASALQLLGPITLAVLTSRQWRDVGCAVLAGCGVWLFHVPHGAGSSLPGVLAALAAGAAMAGYLVLSKKAGARSAGGGPLALAVTWAALLTLPLGLADRGAGLLTPRVLLLGTALAVLSAVIPYSLELAALRRLPVRTVSVLTSLEPASAGLAGVLVLGEDLGLVQWAALACVGAASAGVVAPRSPRRGGRFARRPGEPEESGQQAGAQLLEGAGEKTRDVHL
ncbi:EamA family transporter [Streptomyces longisporoflavus]|uniref:EamA family transporter n=1 Tax=Streptomyces longisporoflavus TaxID=28044 RepID=UPI001E61E02D|nr:EamA family transporter [Streptomyces longisporoflavus]